MLKRDLKANQPEYAALDTVTSLIRKSSGAALISTEECLFHITQLATPLV